MQRSFIAPNDQAQTVITYSGVSFENTNKFKVSKNLHFEKKIVQQNSFLIQLFYIVDHHGCGADKVYNVNVVQTWVIFDMHSYSFTKKYV